MQPFQKIISKPTAKHLYINDNTGFYIRLTPFGNALILGGISIDVTGNDWIKVEFYIDNDLKNIDTESPFQWLWIEKGLSKHVLRVIAYTEFGNTVIDEINVINIF